MKKDKIKTRPFSMRMKEPNFESLLRMQPLKKRQNGTLYSLGMMVEEAIEMYVSSSKGKK